jgi:outer membrane protein insertion porin family
VNDIGRVRTIYRDAGYGDVEADPETTLDRPHGLVDIHIPVKRGPLVTIDRVVVVGNHKVASDLILRAVQIPNGQLFGETKLEEARSRVLLMGAFERVDISTEAKPSASRWTVSFEVEEK